MPRRTVTSLAFNMSVSTRGFFSPQDLKKAEARVQVVSPWWSGNESRTPLLQMDLTGHCHLQGGSLEPDTDGLGAGNS